MHAKKLLLVLGLSVIMALAVFPGAARSEMYVEGYLGGNFAGSADMDRFFWHDGGGFNPLGYTETHHIPGRIDPAVVGGLKLGTWFVKEGFLGFNYPDWAKHLGFYVDFSYHRLDFRRIRMGSFATGIGQSIIPTYTPNNFWSEGTAATLAFMFAARYGFLPDSEVPFGRLQPYLALGPAILFSSQEPGLTSGFIIAGAPAFVGYTINPGSASAVNIALAVEAGLRWMALKNVSLDASFKYRYAQPSYQYSYNDPVDFLPRSFTLNLTYHLFSFQMGAAYHF